MANVAVLSPINERPLSPRTRNLRSPLHDVHPNILSPSKQTFDKANTTEPDDSPSPPSIPPESDLTATHLVSSPYTHPSNLLHLSSLPTPSLLLALSLSLLQPIRPDYATAPYLSSFNWSDVFAHLRTLCAQTNHNWERTEFYVVIFRSKLLETADRKRLGLLDEMSHREACEGGGLLKYWFGETDRERRNLATCLWRNREDAAKGGAGPWHAQARASAREMYETITFHAHKLVVEAGAEEWRLEEYSG